MVAPLGQTRGLVLALLVAGCGGSSVPASAPLAEPPTLAPPAAPPPVEERACMELEVSERDANRLDLFAEPKSPEDLQAERKIEHAFGHRPEGGKVLLAQVRAACPSCGEAEVSLVPERRAIRVDGAGTAAADAWCTASTDTLVRLGRASASPQALEWLEAQVQRQDAELTRTRAQVGRTREVEFQERLVQMLGEKLEQERAMARAGVRPAVACHRVSCAAEGLSPR